MAERLIAPSVIADELTKVYPNGQRAADRVSLCCTGGEIVGVVGPNGAGKSTTLNMLATLLEPTSGSGSVWGIPLEDVDRVRPKLGVALQRAGLDPLMTAAEHFEVQAALYRLDRSWRAKAAALVERFELGPYVDRLVGQYSGGIQRRLALALALLPDPPAIVFDEPSVGLDPRSRRNLWELVRALRDEGRAVLLSTQYLEEADSLCDRVAVITSGYVVAEGTPRGLKARVADRTVVEIETFGVADGALDKLRVVPGVASVAVEQREQAQVLLVQSAKGLELTQALLARLGDVRVGRVAVREPTLEDAYVELVTGGG